MTQSLVSVHQQNLVEPGWQVQSMTCSHCILKMPLIAQWQWRVTFTSSCSPTDARGVFDSQGNMILTDSNYEILTLLRSYRDDVKGYAIMARHPYPIRTVRPRAAASKEALTDALEKAGDKTTLKGELLAFIGWACFDQPNLAATMVA